MIELRTLGGLDLRRADGSELHSVLSQPKRTALLCYLVLARPRGHHRRDTLLPLFWPESDDERARNSLRQSVHFLRRSLGEEAIRSRGDEEVAVDRSVLWCDAVAFEAALDSGDLEGALALYRGDLLPGFFAEGAPELEQWLESERQRLRARAVAGAWELAEARECAGDAAAAAKWARAALALAPTDDALLRDVMRLLARTGDPAGAVATYESDARRLRAEYEVEPSPEARALAEEIRARPAPAARQPEPQAGPLAAARAEPAGATPASPPEPPRPISESPPARRHWRRRRLLPAVAATAVLLGAAAFWAIRLRAGPSLDPQV